MDFFEYQVSAKRRTSLLMAYYTAAVLLIIAAVYASFAAVFLILGKHDGDYRNGSAWWDGTLFLWVTTVAGVVITGGSLYRIRQLSQGGISVALLLGGRQINHNSEEAGERKILNIVEEMAIASGTPVPPVFVLEEETGINAFAAGLTPADAIIGITKGALQQLSRDELQGVIAHEFSHILNGDMRFNIRLMGLLHGIFMLTLIGQFLLRSATQPSLARSRAKNKGNEKLLFALLGLLLMLIGWIGVFFSMLIKSAVSRQREFLADASAVQFTRNPWGIANALKKIKGSGAGARLVTPHASEASHLFFANSAPRLLATLLATHPPLDERIRRLDPTYAWNAETNEASKRTASGGTVFAPGAPGFSMTPAAMIASVGTPKLEHLRFAVQITEHLPPRLRQAAQEPFDAQAVIYGLLLSPESDTRKAQVESLRCPANSALRQILNALASELNKVTVSQRLPLAEIAVATLKEISPSQYLSFERDVQMLMEADAKIDLFEYALQRMILRHLRPAFFGSTAPPKPPSQPMEESCAQLLSCIAHWGSANELDAHSSYSAATAILQPNKLPGVLPRAECTLQLFDAALDDLSFLTPAMTKLLIQSCIAGIVADRVVRPVEAELIRAVADALGYPIPPLNSEAHIA